jgi:hypothetical protein
MFPSGVNYARYLYHVPGTENTLIGSAGAASAAGMGISISTDGGMSWEPISEGYSFLASAWLDLETGWCGTETTASRTEGGMYIYGNPPAPTNLQFEVDVLDVMLTWEAPGGGGGTMEELIYDNDTPTGAYSYDGFTMATHMSPSGPCKVLKMKFYTTTDPGDNTYNATLFEWAGSEPGTDIVYSEAATAVESEWMEIDIAAQNIMFDGDFVVGFGSINETTFVGYDADLDNGRSWDFNNTDETWSSWNEAYHIRAIVEYEDGTRAELGGSSDSPVPAKTFAKTSHPRNYSDVNPVPPMQSRGARELDLLGYNVYRDGSKINSEPVEMTEYMDEDLPIGNVDYYVTAVYTGGESDGSNIVTVVITSVFNNKEELIKIYPNPATDVLNIQSSTQLQMVTILNTAGQMVFQGYLDRGTTSIDISQYNSGVYFVRIENEGEFITKKIVIE